MNALGRARVRAIADVAQVGGARVTVSEAYSGGLRVFVEGPRGRRHDNTSPMRRAVRAALEACGDVVEEAADGALEVQGRMP